MTVRVFITANFRLYREGLAEVLAQRKGIEVVGVAGDHHAMLSGVRELEPDVVLCDPGILEGMDAIREVADPSGRIKVIVLASPETEPELIACAEAGVSGFVSRDDSPADLVATILAVTQGDLRCSPKTAGTLLRRVTALAAERPPEPSGGQLTTRELEVMRLIDEGLSNKQIALRLHIELPTVKHHVHHILEKLGVARRGEAVARFAAARPGAKSSTLSL